MTVEKTYEQQLKAVIRDAKRRNLLTLTFMIIRQVVSSAVACAAIGFFWGLDLDAYPDLLLAGVPVGTAVLLILATYASDNRNAAAFLSAGLTWQTSRRTTLHPPVKPEPEVAGEAS
ncbi:hypothetical protein [Nonomuraea sp. NPDC002799]